MRTTVPSTTSPCLKLRMSASCSASSSSIVEGSGPSRTTGIGRRRVGDLLRAGRRQARPPRRPPRPARRRRSRRPAPRSRAPRPPHRRRRTRRPAPRRHPARRQPPRRAPRPPRRRHRTRRPAPRRHRRRRRPPRHGLLGQLLGGLLGHDGLGDELLGDGVRHDGADGELLRGHLGLERFLDEPLGDGVRHDRLVRELLGGLDRRQSPRPPRPPGRPSPLPRRPRPARPAPRPPGWSSAAALPSRVPAPGLDSARERERRPSLARAVVWFQVRGPCAMRAVRPSGGVGRVALRLSPRWGRESLAQGCGRYNPARARAARSCGPRRRLRRDPRRAPADRRPGGRPARPAGHAGAGGGARRRGRGGRSDGAASTSSSGSRRADLWVAPMLSGRFGLARAGRARSRRRRSRSPSAPGRRRPGRPPHGWPGRPGSRPTTGISSCATSIRRGWASSTSPRPGDAGERAGRGGPRPRRRRPGSHPRRLAGAHPAPSRRAEAAAPQPGLRGGDRQRLQRRDPVGGAPQPLPPPRVAGARGDRRPVRGDPVDPGRGHRGAAATRARRPSRSRSATTCRCTCAAASRARGAVPRSARWAAARRRRTAGACQR